MQSAKIHTSGSPFPSKLAHSSMLPSAGISYFDVLNFDFKSTKVIDDSCPRKVRAPKELHKEEMVHGLSAIKCVNKLCDVCFTGKHPYRVVSYWSSCTTISAGPSSRRPQEWSIPSKLAHSSTSPSASISYLTSLISISNPRR